MADIARTLWKERQTNKLEFSDEEKYACSLPMYLNSTMQDVHQRTIASRINKHPLLVCPAIRFPEALRLRVRNQEKVEDLLDAAWRKNIIGNHSKVYQGGTCFYEVSFTRILFEDEDKKFLDMDAFLAFIEKNATASKSIPLVEIVVNAIAGENLFF